MYETPAKYLFIHLANCKQYLATSLKLFSSREKTYSKAKIMNKWVYFQFYREIKKIVYDFKLQNFILSRKIDCEKERGDDAGDFCIA